MSGTVFVVTSGKGGVGKSTTALNLGVALGVDGHSVALVDADLGMANLGAMLGVESEPTLHDVLAGQAHIEDAVVAEGETFGVLPGGRGLARYAEADPARLPDVLATLADRYEYVVVDAGAGLGYTDVVPIDAADEVILVTTPEDAAVGDTAKMAAFSERVNARVRGVVVTRAGEDVDPGAIVAEVGADLLAVIPEDPAVPTSTSAGVPLEQHAPDSPAAAAYRKLADAVSGGATGDDSGTEGTREDAGDDVSETAEGPTDVSETDAGDAPDDEGPSGSDRSDDEAPAEGDDETSAGDDDTPEPDRTSETKADAETSAGEGKTSDDEETPDGDGETSDGDGTEEGGSGGVLSRLRGLF